MQRTRSPPSDPRPQSSLQLRLQPALSALTQVSGALIQTVNGSKPFRSFAVLFLNLIPKFLNRYRWVSYIEIEISNISNSTFEKGEPSVFLAWSIIFILSLQDPFNHPLCTIYAPQVSTKLHSNMWRPRHLPSLSKCRSCSRYQSTKCRPRLVLSRLVPILHPRNSSGCRCTCRRCRSEMAISTRDSIRR